MRGQVGRATYLHQLLAILLPLGVAREPRAHVGEHPCLPRPHSRPFPPRRDHARPSQVSQVARHLRLADSLNLHEETDAHFVPAHEVQRAQASGSNWN
ncbi:MAG: hypothetical protein M3R15_07950 [Acidobacteriota bacterium]|nr:hypothetical protein [Acidobacteriota bacterium]